MYLLLHRGVVSTSRVNNVVLRLRITAAPRRALATVIIILSIGYATKTIVHRAWNPSRSNTLAMFPLDISVSKPPVMCWDIVPMKANRSIAESRLPVCFSLNLLTNLSTSGDAKRTSATRCSQ